jgi:hypothetical protein
LPLAALFFPPPIVEQEITLDASEEREAISLFFVHYSFVLLTRRTELSEAEPRTATQLCLSMKLLLLLFGAIAAVAAAAITAHGQSNYVSSPLQNPFFSSDSFPTISEENSSVDDLDVAPSSVSRQLLPEIPGEQRRAPALLDTLPTGSTPVTSGYYYLATCADSKCSSKLVQSFTILNTCFPAGDSGSTQVTAAFDNTVTTTLYYLTTQYADTACKAPTSSVLSTVPTNPNAMPGTTQYQAYGTATSLPATTGFYITR